MLTQLDYYKKIYDEIIKPTIETDTDVNEDKAFNVSGVNYNLPKETLRHIKYGDYDNAKALHKNGGHTQATLDLLNKICEAKLTSNTEENPLVDELKKEVLGDSDKSYEESRTLGNGVRSYKFLDSCDPHKQLKSFFPKNWNINSDNLCKIAQACIENGIKKDAAKGHFMYICKINGVCIGTVVDEKTKLVLTIYPLDAQEPNDQGFYNIEDPKKSSEKLNIEADEMKEVSLPDLLSP